MDLTIPIPAPKRLPHPLHITRDSALTASEQWGANCGPGALCALTGLDHDGLRPFMRFAGFEGKGYTNPTMMQMVLDNLYIPWRLTYRGDAPLACPNDVFPRWGLVRVQWVGPWTDPGRPMRARYRHTHWVASYIENCALWVFDINAIHGNRDWICYRDWADFLVPWLMSEVCPKATGWWPTHAYEISV